MSLQIIKAGLLDTIQDLGRYGYQHLGINPGGAMDRYAAQLANALLGKDLNSPVIEMHFPSCEILFKEETIICLTGADFTPTIERKKIPVNQPVAVNKNTALHFEKKIAGARCYLSLLHELDQDKWRNSYSTNIVANAGGFKGRALKKGDKLNFKNNFKFKYLLEGNDLIVLSWKATGTIQSKKEIRFIKGNEWDWLADESIKLFTENNYKILNNSNRMGYRLEGNELKVKEDKQLISSGVTFGTIQLLPGGQLIVLMADHQTTGGYPRIGHVISADLPLLAQHNPGGEIKFSEVELAVAEQEFIRQERDLLHIQTASQYKIENILNAM
ncbi:MAG TPA: biotin-dependent carboxyltransferase family protein [Chitinophagaceae bacterium]|nr:biotin-dependent carboxyltransferase family protein [Chitinophagaceae bacterium]